MSKTRMARTLFVVAVTILVTGCRLVPKPPQEDVVSPPAPTEAMDEATALLVAMARVDLAARLDVGIEQTAFQRLEPTEFPDASLGAPEPGQVYAQVVTPGYIIELVADGQTYIYHAAGERVVAAPAGQITIEGVRVSAEAVDVHGMTTLPDNTCVTTELVAGEAVAAWWPADTCASIEGGAWEMSVSLSDEQALQPGLQYLLRAFQATRPDIGAAFPFDLEPPPAGPEEQAPQDDPALLLPEGAEVVSQASGDLDGDGLDELVFVAGLGGVSDDLSYGSLRLFVLAPSADARAVAGYELAWQSEALFGQRDGILTLQDITGDGNPEVLCLQSVGASGQVIQILAWSAGGYRLLRPVGGRFDGEAYFGEKGVRLVDEDGDGRVEIYGAYGPAASQSDAYGWDGADYIYIQPLDETGAAFVRVQVAGANLSLEVPADWTEGTPGVWTAPGGASLRLGVNWVDLQAPQEPEAALLPQPAQILESEPVVLVWGSGRTFTLEVYGEAVEGGGQAPVESVETHVLVVVDRKGGRRAYDVYTSAPSAGQLAGIEDVLAHALATVVLE